MAEECIVKTTRNIINKDYRMNGGWKKMAKSKWVSFFLCLFLGVLGIHKFYEGRVLLGILYLFTVGLFGVGVIIDLIVLFFKPNPYYP